MIYRDIKINLMLKILIKCKRKKNFKAYSNYKEI